MFLKAWLDVKGNTMVKMLKSKLHQLDKEQNRHKENKILTWHITKYIAVILFELEILFECYFLFFFFTHSTYTYQNQLRNCLFSSFIKIQYHFCFVE